MKSRHRVTRFYPILTALALSGAAVVTAFRCGGPVGNGGARVAAERVKRPIAFEANRGQANPSVRFLSRGSGYAVFLTQNESILALAPVPAGVRAGLEVPAKPKTAVLRMRLEGGNPAPRIVPETRLEGRSHYLIGNDPRRWHADIPHFGRILYQQVYPGIDLAYYGNPHELEHDFIVKPGSDPGRIRIEYRGAEQLRLAEDGSLEIHTAVGVLKQRKPFAYQKVGDEVRAVPARYVQLARNRIGFELGAYDPRRTLVIDPVLVYTSYIGGSMDEYPFGMAIDPNRHLYLTGYTGSFNQDADPRPANVPPAEGGPYFTSVPGLPALRAFFTTPGTFQPNDPDRFTDSFDLSLPRNNSIDATYAFSNYDAFVVKLNENGGVIWATYLGGSAPSNGGIGGVHNGDDYGMGIAVGQDLTVYVTGFSYSLNFPLRFPLQGTTNDGLTKPAGTADAFITRLNQDGSALIYSTYLGGSGQDRGRAIAVDGTGNAHVAGVTSSLDFPVTSAGGLPFQPAHGGGTWDAFVVSLDASGSAMNYATYLGGSGEEDGASVTLFGTTLNSGINFHIRDPNYTAFIPTVAQVNNPARILGTDGVDRCVAIAVDPLGNTTVVGGTTSADFPVLGSPFQATKGLGYDAFITRFNPAGQPTYSSYLGGDGDEAARSVVLDSNGNVLLTGYTSSTNFPTQPPGGNAGAPAFQASNAGGLCDAFVTKLNASGQLGPAGTFSTYLGGNGEDIAHGITVSAGGQAYVTGATTSTYPSFPLELPFQSNNRGSRDAFIVKYRPDGSRYEYSTFWGTAGQERTTVIAVDPPTANVSTQAYLGGFQYLGSEVGPTGIAPNPEVFIFKFHAPPFQAANLDFTNRTQSTVDLVWVDQSDNEDAFDIERKPDLNGNNVFGVVGTVGRGSNTVLTAGITATSTTLQVVDARDQYVNNLIRVDNEVMQITAKAGNTLTVTRGVRGTTPAAHSAGAIVTTHTVGSVTFNDGGLQPGTTYTYRVRPWNTTGPIDPALPKTFFRFYGAYSNQLTVTTLPGPPAAPSGLTAVALDRSRIRITWVDNSTNEGDSAGVAFRLERRQVPLGNWTEIATFAARPGTGFMFDLEDGNTTLTSNAVPLTHSLTTPLQSSTTYEYRVFVRNDVAEVQGVNPSTASATTLPDPPGTAPTDLAATAVSNQEIDLTWTYADAVAVSLQGFHIERATETTPGSGVPGTFVRIRTLTTNTPPFSYQDTGLPANTLFFYRVKPYNASGDGTVYSNVAQARTLPTPPTPGPSNLVVDLIAPAANNPSSVVIRFQDNSSDEDGFKIDRSEPDKPLPSGPSNRFEIPANPGTGPVVVNDPGNPLQRNSVYTYRVIAFKRNMAGDSDSVPSNNACVLTLPEDAGGPLTLTATATDQIDVGWLDRNPVKDPNNTQNTPSVFRIERSVTSDFSSGVQTFVQSYPAPTASTPVARSFTDTGLSANTRYFYRVRAMGQPPTGCLGGGDQPGAPLTGAAYTLALPATGVTVVCLPPSTGMRISWQDANAGTARHRIERSTDPNFGMGNVTVVATVAAGTNTYDDVTPRLVGNTVYYYRVRALNGDDIPAAPALPNPPGTLNAPAKPVNVAATPVSQTEMDLAWQWQDNSPPSGFRVEQSADGGASWTEVARVSTPGSSYRVTGLTAGTSYQFRIRGENACGLGEYSDAVGADTLQNAPNPPTGLTARVLSSSSIELVWTDSSTNEDGFRLERVKGSSFATGTNFTVVTTLLRGTHYEVAPGSPPTGTRRYTDTGLEPSTRYTYRVAAFNNSGQDSYSREAGGTTFGVAPAAPDSLAVAVVSDRALRLTWMDRSTNETEFRVQRKPGAPTDPGTFVTVARIARPDPTTVNVPVTYTNSGLQPNSTYSYRVLANNSGTDSAPSNVASGTTLPAAPTGLSARPLSQTSVEVSWTDNNPAGTVSRFKVERSDDGGVSYRMLDAAFPGNPGGRTVTFTDTGLAADRIYLYRVRATNASGDSAPAGPVSVRTLPLPPPTPRGLSARPTSLTSIEVTWLDVTGETGYELERSLTGQAGSFTRIATLGADVTRYLNTGLSPDTVYYYRLRAVNAGGASGYSAVVSARTPAGPPAAPSDLRVVNVATDPQTALRLTWTDNSDNEEGFRIERKNGTGAFAEIATVGRNVRAYTDTGLTANTTYTYRVRAFLGPLLSAYSNEASGTTRPNPPAAPTNLRATALGPTAVRLDWTDNSDNEMRFRIERRPAGGSFSEIGSVAANIRTFTDRTVAPGTTYTYRVRAWNTGGFSAYSNPVVVTTPAAARTAGNGRAVGPAPGTREPALWSGVRRAWQWLASALARWTEPGGGRATGAARGRAFEDGEGWACQHAERQGGGVPSLLRAGLPAA